MSAAVIDALKKLAPAPLPDETWRTLEAAYATPPRAYHTLKHVLEVAQLFAAEQWAHPNDVFLAVLFHDAVYDVHRHDNEELSAQRYAPNPRVAELIRLTARHGKLKPEDVDDEAARFLDCDMAILAAEPKRFAEYEAQIAQEYVPVVGKAGYAQGRRVFLERLLAKERIFLSDAFHRRFDAAARRNLRDACR